MLRVCCRVGISILAAFCLLPTTCTVWVCVVCGSSSVICTQPCIMAHCLHAWHSSITGEQACGGRGGGQQGRQQE